MQVTTEPQVSVLPNPDELTDIHELRTVLKSAYDLLFKMAASTRQAADAVHYVTGMIAPVVSAHQQGNHGEVKRLLDAYIESGEVEFVRANKPVTH